MELTNNRTYDVYRYTNTNGSGAYYPSCEYINADGSVTYYPSNESENPVSTSDNIIIEDAVSPAKSKFKNLLNRIMEFHKWLEREQESLEEESGADLSGVIDKLEETFSELSEETNYEYTITYLNSQLI